MFKFIFILFLLSSCAYYPYKESKDSSGMIVDLEPSKKRVLPKISEENSLMGYGPQDGVSKNSNKSVQRKTINAYIFGPGGYRCLSYISVLREIEEVQNSSLRPSVLIGHGLCSVVAAYYSFGYDPEYIEWKFFGFLRKVKDLGIFSKDWLDIFKSDLINDLADKRIEDSKLTLILPILSDRSEIMFLTRGSLKDGLIANVSLYSDSKYKPLFTKKYLDKKKLESIGVSKIFVFDVLSDGVNFFKGNGYIRGQFEKAVSQFIKEKSQFDIIISIPLKKYKIDDSKMASNLIYESKKYMKNTMSKLVKSELN